MPGTGAFAHCTGTVVLSGIPPMYPVMVNELVPLGTVMLKEAEEAPVAMETLDGKEETDGLLLKYTVVGWMAPLANDKVTVAGPPAGAGVGMTVMALKDSSTQARFLACAGGVGGVFQGALAKSKNSVMSGWAASRAVKLGSPNRVSMNFSMAV